MAKSVVVKINHYQMNGQDFGMKWGYLHYCLWFTTEMTIDFNLCPTLFPRVNYFRPNFYIVQCHIRIHGNTSK